MHTDIQEAEKIPLLELIEQIKPGDELILKKNGEAVAKIISFKQTKKVERQPGAMKGKIKMKDNFDDPLPDEIARPFGMVD